MNNIIVNEETLISQVNKNTDDITQLKSNVKWIYQYGGVGGSGGGTTQSWSIYATLDNQVLKNNGQVILDTEDKNGNKIKHNLTVSISKPNGLTYTLKTIKFYDGTELYTKIINKKLSPGNYEYVFNNININGNGTDKNSLVIEVDCDDDPDPKTLTCSTICNPFSASSTFQEYKNGTYKTIGNKDSIYVSTINNLYLTINYTLYVSSDSIVKLIFNNTNLQFKNYPTNGQYLISDRTGTIRFEIDEDTFNDSRYYGINNINMYIEIDDGSDNPKKIDISTSCTLIPNGLFLRISPYYTTNNLHNDISYISTVKSFNTGLLYLNLTGYYGTPNARTFNVSCIKTKVGTVQDNIITINDSYILPSKSDFLISEESKLFNTTKNILNINSISELTVTKSYLNISEPGIYALSFLVSIEENGEIILSDDIYVYYICVLAAQNTANWIEDIEFEQLSSITDANGHIHNTLNSFAGAISEEYSLHYRFGNDITDNILPYVNKYGSYITVNSNNESDIKLFNITPISGALEQYVINIGIQYSSVNDTNDPIFTIYGNNKSYDIVFYQNKIIFSNQTLETYIPLSDSYDPNDPTKYHLISIVRQKMNESTACYSYIFYIDGIQETALGGAWVDGISYTGITLHKSNYSINLIDFANIAYEINDEYHDKIYKLDIRDHIIAEYYMQYAINIFSNNIDQQILKSINSLTISKNFIFEDNVIKVKNGLSTLTELKKTMTDTPIMVLDFSEESSYNTKQDFFNNFFFINAENNKKKIIFSGLYYNSFSEPEKDANGRIIKQGDLIKIPNGYWTIEHQGSSTLTYKIKNLELASNTLDTGDNASMYIFSPNFKNVSDSMDDKEKENIYITSFLPEVSYTLKADEMDSSHCNNTSIGLFVNKNTTKFADVQNLATVASSKYKNYIKNCLTGYPCLIFIQLKNEEDNSKELYYLGIYNFNLGRESAFNLGYRDTNILDNIKAYNKETNSSYEEIGLKDGFNLYNIQVSAIDKQNKNICVAEIQGNDSRFDFSQYDMSILFDQSIGSQKDNYYMLGDIVPKYNDPTEQGNQKSLLRDFIKSITLAGGFIFDTLGKGMSDTIVDEYGYKEGYGYKSTIPGYPQISKNMVPNYRYQSKRTLNGNTNTYTYNRIPDAVYTDLQNAICETRDEFGNLQHLPTLDYRSILEYYVICMAFGMVDSVQKNLNIKSWTADQANTLGTRFYAAFYDMDTSNGKTNGGGKTNKYAFSDYWVTLHNASIQLEQSQIFRDFFPVSSEGDAINNKPGYDTPSSYLFAIAKYASLFGVNDLIQGISDITDNICPENFWAFLRNSEGKNGSGELRNAKYFIDNYFYVNMNKIPIQFISLNYRFKYLQLAENSFDSSTLEKFSGLGKYYAQDWLNDRFHILDAYFNLQQENKQVLKYNYDALLHANIDELTNLDSVTELVFYNTQQLSYNSNTETNIPDGYYVDTTNPDIYVINHIFNTNSGAQIKGYMKPFSISAFNMSPLIIKGTNNTIVGSYIIPDSTKTYTINVHKESNENWMFGGSQAWTKIENILPFIGENGGFYVHSDKLRTIGGNQGVCGSWQIECQSLQELTLIGANYTGKLNIDCKMTSPNAKYWQNIKTININGSQIQLSIDNATINSITCNDVNIEAYELSIIDCKLLETLLFNNLVANKLTITPVNKDNFLLSNCDIKQATLSPKVYNSKFTIQNIENLEKITISPYSEGTLESLIIQNCQKINELKINSSIVSSIEYLKITNYSFENLTNTSSDNIYVENNVLHLEKFTKLKSLSLENTLGYDTVILPNNDIELLAKAFYDTDLIYIDYEDKQNNNHKLILCDDNELVAGDDCAIFYNSKFSLMSTYNDPLKFAVKQKWTSLNNLFHINKEYYTLGVHNGVANISYIRAQQFIESLENKQYVVSFNNGFHRQSQIVAIYQINSQTYTANSIIDITDPSKRISFNGYKNLKSINGIFEHTMINFIDDVLFSGTFAENITGDDTIDILNCVPFDYTVYMHFNALDNIKTKIDKFLFDGRDDSNISRNSNSLAMYIYGTSDSVINIHNLLFKENTYSKMTVFSGFKTLSNQLIDINGLFTEYEKSITDIHNVFTNLDQSTSGGLQPIYNFSLSELVNLSVLYESFIGVQISGNKQLDINKTIDIITYLDWSVQYVQLQQYIKTYNLFNFYKKVSLLTNEDKNIWNNFWRIIKTENIDDSINYMFSQCIFKMNDGESLEILPNDNITLDNITYGNGLFANAKCYVNNEDVGFTLSDTTLDKFNKLKYANEMFSGCTLNGTSIYPLPTGLLSNLTGLLSCANMFTNVKINGNHKTYVNETYKKQVYYKYNLANNQLNYPLDDINNNQYSSLHTFYGYPIVPPTLFKYNKNLNNIDNIFSNSDFEGYLPSDLLIGSDNQPLQNIQSINNFLYNCKLLPQIYHKFTNEDTVNIYKPSNNLANITDTIAFVFIPENFIQSNGYNRLNSINIFNFKLLVSGDPKYRLYLFSDKSLENKSLENIKLIIDDESKIVNKWYYDKVNMNYIQYDSIYANYIGYINLCINKNDNTYTEGISINMWDMIGTRGCTLIEPYLASIYYGYIFEPGTLLYNIDSSISIGKYFASSIIDTYKPDNSDMQTAHVIMSPNIILPGIIYHQTVNSDVYPDSIAIGTPLGQLYNKYYKECLFSINCDMQTININAFDMSFIDNFTYTITEDTDNAQYICTAKYNQFEYSKIYQNSITEEQFINECRSDLIQLVYNNYNLLFNKYQPIKLSPEGAGVFSPYNTFMIDDDNNNSEFIYVTSLSDGKILKRSYNVLCYNDNGIIRISSIN